VDPFEAVNTLLEGNRGLAAGVMTLAGALVVAFAVSKPPRLPEIHETTPIPMIDFTIRIFLSGAAISASAWAAVETLFVGGALSPSSREEVNAMLDAINSAPGLTSIVFLYSFFVYPLMIAVSRLREAKRLLRAHSANPSRPAGRRNPPGPRIAGHRRKRKLPRRTVASLGAGLGRGSRMKRSGATSVLGHWRLRARHSSLPSCWATSPSRTYGHVSCLAVRWWPT
jgi:hypothetical protein